MCVSWWSSSSFLLFFFLLRLACASARERWSRSLGRLPRCLVESLRSCLELWRQAGAFPGIKRRRKRTHTESQTTKKRKHIRARRKNGERERDRERGGWWRRGGEGRRGRMEREWKEEKLQCRLSSPEVVVSSSIYLVLDGARDAVGLSVHHLSSLLYYSVVYLSPVSSRKRPVCIYLSLICVSGADRAVCR